MAVANELARGENRGNELHPVDNGVEPALEKLNQVLAGVAAAAHRLNVITVELLFADVAVIAFELLLGGQVEPVIGRFLAAAAMLAGARAPLVEADLSKAEVRVLSLHFELESWDKPAAPCLSSRIAYGEYITPAKLSQVEQAEAFVRAEGFTEFRVRHHDDVARLELRTEDFEKFFADGRRERIIENLKSTGYTYVTLDAGGFRSGSMNDILEALPLIQG